MQHREGKEKFSRIWNLFLSSVYSRTLFSSTQQSQVSLCKRDAFFKKKKNDFGTGTLWKILILHITPYLSFSLKLNFIEALSVQKCTFSLPLALFHDLFFVQLGSLPADNSYHPSKWIQLPGLFLIPPKINQSINKYMDERINLTVILYTTFVISS